MTERLQLRQARRLVIKIGSALLTNDGRGLDVAALGLWVDQIAELIEDGVEVVVVSSGSVAEGMSRLGWTVRPEQLHELQAAAAVGQMGLVQTWEAQFKRHDIHTAQILLTHDDLSDRKRYLNGRGTLRALLNLGVVPIVNENDTVATDEIRYGDNDRLAARVALMAGAEKAQAFYLEEAKKEDAESRTVFADNGVEIDDMTAEEFAAWQDIAAETSYKAFVEETPNGQELLDMALSVE